MVLNEVVERVAKRSPLTVMVHVALSNVLDAAWINQLFDQHRETQYTRELLFSTVVDLMSLVALGLRPSVHAAASAMGEELTVSVQALYDKLRRTEPSVVRGLVTGSAERLAPVVGAMQNSLPLTVPGYRLRILDGNHLAASEKRLKPLRGFRGAALPGQSLVVYDPDLELVVDLLPCEDGHSHERAYIAPLLEKARPGELWIADRSFSTRAILGGWAAAGSAFLVREHAANPNPRPRTPLQCIGRIDTGVVFEQEVLIEDAAGVALRLRRIELRLKRPTDDGESVIRLLTNLPNTFTAQQLAALYRKRWRIESLFQRLESVLQSEISTLGHPRAALLAFGVAVLAYNVLSLLMRAVRTAHPLACATLDLSPYYFAIEIKARYDGMMITLPLDAFEGYEQLSSVELAQTLLTLAQSANPKYLKSHPRGPKKPKKKGYVSKHQAQRHVATARVLKDGKIR